MQTYVQITATATSKSASAASTSPQCRIERRDRSQVSQTGFVHGSRAANAHGTVQQTRGPGMRATIGDFRGVNIPTAASSQQPKPAENKRNNRRRVPSRPDPDDAEGARLQQGMEGRMITMRGERGRMGIVDTTRKD